MKVTYKHHEIYRTLVAEIAEGYYDATQRLPSEAQLVRRFSVSRPTAARALRDLQSEGVVERRVGAGSFLIKGARPSKADTSRHLGVLLPDLGVTELLDVLCGELAGQIVPQLFCSVSLIVKHRSSRGRRTTTSTRTSPQFRSLG